MAAFQADCLCDFHRDFLLPEVAIKPCTRTRARTSRLSVATEKCPWIDICSSEKTKDNSSNGSTEVVENADCQLYIHVNGSSNGSTEVVVYTCIYIY